MMRLLHARECGDDAPGLDDALSHNWTSLHADATRGVAWPFAPTRPTVLAVDDATASLLLLGGCDEALLTPAAALSLYRYPRASGGENSNRTVTTKETLTAQPLVSSRPADPSAAAAGAAAPVPAAAAFYPGDAAVFVSADRDAAGLTVWDTEAFCPAGAVALPPSQGAALSLALNPLSSANASLLAVTHRSSRSSSSSAVVTLVDLDSATATHSLSARAGVPLCHAAWSPTCPFHVAAADAAGGVALFDVRRSANSACLLQLRRVGARRLPRADAVHAGAKPQKRRRVSDAREDKEAEAEAEAEGVEGVEDGAGTGEQQDEGARARRETTTPQRQPRRATSTNAARQRGDGGNRHGDEARRKRQRQRARPRARKPPPPPPPRDTLGLGCPWARRGQSALGVGVGGVGVRGMLSAAADRLSSSSARAHDSAHESEFGGGGGMKGGDVSLTTRLEFVPDGTELVTRQRGAGFAVWDVLTGCLLRTFLPAGGSDGGHGGRGAAGSVAVGVEAFRVARDGMHVLAGLGGHLAALDVADGGVVQLGAGHGVSERIGRGAEVGLLELHPKEEEAVSATRDGVTFWSPRL